MIALHCPKRHKTLIVSCEACRQPSVINALDTIIPHCPVCGRYALDIEPDCVAEYASEPIDHGFCPGDPDW